jgi:hypothetical protein
MRFSAVEPLTERLLEFWTFSCACSNRPKGEQRTAQGLQPWERHPQRNRPERAPGKASTTNGIVSLSTNVISGNDARHSAAHSGRFSRGRLLRAEALGCSVFALRATAECPNSTQAEFYSARSQRIVPEGRLIPQPRVEQTAELHSKLLKACNPSKHRLCLCVSCHPLR